MSELNVENALQNIENSNLRSLLSHLLEQLSIKDEKILSLENRVSDLEARVNECEVYSSKDCIIIENAPLNPNFEQLELQVCDFFRRFLSFSAHPSDFKACHFLGPWKNSNYPPAIIVKFIYFNQKNEIFGRKSWLARALNPINRKPIYMKERLPPQQRSIKQKADDFGLITTTQNCNVKVFMKNEDNTFKSVVVKSVQAVEDIKHCAVKKKQLEPAKSATVFSTPAPKKSGMELQLKSALKRIRSSPDAEGMATLKALCLGTVQPEIDEQTSSNCGQMS